MGGFFGALKLLAGAPRSAKMAVKLCLFLGTILLLCCCQEAWFVSGKSLSTNSLPFPFKLEKPEQICTQNSTQNCLLQRHQVNRQVFPASNTNSFNIKPRGKTGAATLQKIDNRASQMIHDVGAILESTADDLGNRCHKIKQSVEETAGNVVQGVLKNRLHKRMLAGAVSRVLIQTLLYPLEAQRQMVANHLPIKGIRSLYRGFVPSMCFGEIPYSAICVSVQAKASEAIDSMKTSLPSFVKQLLSSLAADSAAVAYKTPHDVMKKYRLTGKADSCLESTSTLCKHSDDLLTAYRGFPIQVLRDSIYRVLNTKCMYSLRQLATHIRSGVCMLCVNAIIDYSKISMREKFDQLGEKIGLKESSGSRLHRKLGAMKSLSDACSAAKEFQQMANDHFSLLKQRANLIKSVAHLKMRQWFHRETPRSWADKATESALVGGISGAVCSVAVYPLDVLKGHVLQNPAVYSQSLSSFKGFGKLCNQLLQTVCTAEGISKMFVGVGQRASLAGVCSAVALVVIETIMNI